MCMLLLRGYSCCFFDGLTLLTNARVNFGLEGVIMEY